MVRSGHVRRSLGCDVDDVVRRRIQLTGRQRASDGLADTKLTIGDAEQRLTDAEADARTACGRASLVQLTRGLFCVGAATQAQLRHADHGQAITVNAPRACALSSPDIGERGSIQRQLLTPMTLRGQRGCCSGCCMRACRVASIISQRERTPSFVNTLPTWYSTVLTHTSCRTARLRRIRTMSSTDY